jgi:DNA-binding LacI/PurR family transcriptional regulator
MRSTLKDVANAANVSIRTVSRVVNNQGEISEKTRQRIWEIIDQLEYRPNQLARGLITGKTFTVGVIIPDITDPFFPEFILSIEATAHRRNYNVFLCNANRQPDTELKYVDLLSQRQVDGLLIAGSRLEENDLSKAIHGHNTVILTPYYMPDSMIFTIDDFGGGKQIGEHLLELGHRHVGYIEGAWSRSSAGRGLGLVTVFENAGIKDAVLSTSIQTISVENASEAARELLNQHPTLTALVGYNDTVALGILQACRELGKKIPQEISVVGFDDIPEASRSIPSMTTFHIDRSSLGEKMMTALLDEIEGKDVPHMQILVDGHLVKRESSSPVGIS